MTDQGNAKTIGNDAVASHPGNLRLNALRWLRCRPRWPAIWLATLLVPLALALWVHWIFWPGVLFGLWVNRFYWLRVKEHFSMGCANPARVVAVNPLRIAAGTNLTKGEGSYPAVKVLDQHLNSVCGEKPTVGTRVVTVALYETEAGKEALPHYTDVDPVPADCATGDIGAIRKLRDAFTPEDWEELDTMIESVPQPFQPGLYKLWEQADSGPVEPPAGGGTDPQG